MNKDQILNKIEEYYKFKSNAEFARFLGVKPQVLSNWKARNTFDIELVSSKCSEINPDWLLHGKGAMKRLATKSDSTKLDKKEQNQIPLFDLKDSLDLVPKNPDSILEYLSLPIISNVDGAIYVAYDNMFPILKENDIVLYQSIPLDIDKIEFGTMYLLSIYIDEVTTYKTIRYIQKSDQSIQFLKMSNENKQYLDKDISISKIAAIAKIRASIGLK